MKRLKIAASSSEDTPQKQSFEELYLESYGRVYSYVRLRMGPSPDVEDVVAEAYLRAARAFDRFDPSRAKFSTWVITLAMNVLKDHWRRLRPTVALDDVPEARLSIADETDDVANQMLVGELLGVLTAEEADLILMKYRDGKRNVDIAAELGMNASTVSTKLFNAIHKMRAAAEEMAKGV